MRINLFIASATGLSRRAADKWVAGGKVTINGRVAVAGNQVQESDSVILNGEILSLPSGSQTIMLNKPVGYVCSRDGQGSKTVYDLLPPAFQRLKPVGRLDKDSSGLLLLTNNGQLANKLTHPSFNKDKVYEVELDKPLGDTDKAHLEKGVELQDGLSRLELQGEGRAWEVTIHEGRNRQIRRSFAALDYKVQKLHRTKFGDYELGALKTGNYLIIN